jgi:uncharacterized membrane protein
MVFAKNANRKRLEADLSSPANNPLGSSENDAADFEPAGRCPHCGAELADDAALCPDCKWPMTPLTPAERAAAAVAYLPLLPAVVILFLPAFRSNRFVRFHAWQSLALWIAFFILSSAALFLSNIAAAVVFLVVGILVSMAMLFLWIVLSLKAWQGERFELPLLGELATRMK